MGLFDLPTGELELLMDGKWKSVMFTDRLTSDEVETTVKEWSTHHKVESARYTLPSGGKPYIVWGKAVSGEQVLMLGRERSII